MKTILRILAMIAATICFAQTPKENLQRAVQSNTVTGSSQGVAYRVQTIAALKAVTVANVTDKQQVEVVCYATSGDGGGGLFYYSAASAATDNGGTIIAPTVGTGRWLRVFKSPYLVTWFGAKTNDTTSDSTTAIQAAINQAGVDGGGTVRLPAGSYKVTSTLTLSSNGVVLAGDGMFNTSLTRSGDYGDTVLMTGNDGTGTLISNCEVKNLTLISTGLTTSGSQIRMNGTFHCNIDSVYVSEGFYGFRFSGATGVTVRNTTIIIDNLFTGSGTNRAYVLCDAAAGTYAHPTSGDLEFSDFNWRGGASGVAQYGLELTGADGIWLSNGHIGSATSANTAIANVGNMLGVVFFDNVNFDGAATTHNILFEGNASRGRFIQFSNCDIEGNGTTTSFGITFGAGCMFSDVTFTGCRVFGHASHGVQLVSTSTYRITFTGCHVENNNALNAANIYGYRIDPGVGSISIVGGTAGSTDGIPCFQTAGIAIGSGAGDDILIDGVSTTGNATAGIVSFATGDNVHIVNCYDGSANTVASASAIDLPLSGDVVLISGNVDINSITAQGNGQKAFLRFSGTLTVKNGTGNLKLSADFAATPDDTLSLICDGTNWEETAHSHN